MRRISKVFTIVSVVQLFFLSVALVALYHHQPSVIRNILADIGAFGKQMIFPYYYQSSVIRNIAGDWVYEFVEPEYPEGYEGVVMIRLSNSGDRLFLSFTDSTVAMNWGEFVPYRIEQNKNSNNPSIIIYKKQDSIKMENYGEITRIAVNELDTLPLTVIGREIETDRVYRRLLPKTQAHFDSILFASGGCYGACPVFSMMIHSDGHVSFHGGKCTEKEGYYSGVLSESQSKSILKKFQQVDFDRIDSIYGEHVVDDHSRYMILYSEGKKRLICVFSFYDEPMELSILLHYFTELYKWIDLEEVLPFRYKDI